MSKSLEAQFHSQKRGTEKPHGKGLRLLSGKLHAESKINISSHYTGKLKEGSE